MAHILHLIIENPKADALEVLLKNADPTLLHKYNLHEIIRCGNTEVAQSLIKRGINLDTVDIGKDGDLILHTIVRSKNLLLLELFIHTASDFFAIQLNRSNSKMHTPLMIAAESGFVDGVKLLLDHNAKIWGRDDEEIRDHFGHTMLHQAVRSKNLDLVNLFLSLDQYPLKLNVNATTNIHKLTPLNLAIRSGQLEIVKALVAAGANLNQKTSSTHEDNALHYAVRHRQTLPLIKLLVEEGSVHMHARNKHGETALDLAISLSYDVKIIQFLHQCLKTV